MSQAASQAAAFYRDVAIHRKVWTVRDEEGFPTFTKTGQQALPFWSTLSRVQRMIKNVPTFHNFKPYEVSLDDFLRKWLPDFHQKSIYVGVNYSGPLAVGYDKPPTSVFKSILHATNSSLENFASQ